MNSIAAHTHFPASEPSNRERLLDAAAAKQRAASDPSVSAWVRANAGTGKTHVLVQRILRLLLAGAAPKSILCLTFTKNAAAEMEARVLAELGDWATATGESLAGKLKGLLGRPATPGENDVARCLFASVIDAPGGLPMLTMHAFCERILRSYSLEANVPAQFAILTEDEAADALDTATAGAFALADREPFKEALAQIVSNAGEDEFAKTLQSLLCDRAAIARLLRLAETEDPAIEVEARLRRLFGLSAADRFGETLQAACAVLSEATVKAAIIVLSGGSKNDSAQASRLSAAGAAHDLEAKFAALTSAFLTGKGTPRKDLMTAALKKKAGALCEELVRARDAIVSASDKLCKLRCVEASVALLVFAARIFELYESEKRRRGALDFDDLIEKTLSLLSRTGSASWVLQQLDARIDHVLVDEAQDTSPNQWAIVEYITGDFFSGDGSRETAPTVFAVGDEKQSIYGFQGAAPHLLSEYGERYRARAAAAGLRWRETDLDLSFRSLSPVLDAVDRVCGALPGLSHSPAVPHVSFRGSANGFVEIWEPEIGEKVDIAGPWDAKADAEAKPHASQLLADRIAAHIENLLRNGSVLPSTQRPIEPGDLLILLRKRDPMLSLLQLALKRRAIPVAGVDRMALLDAVAVLDLLALVDALLQPDDDLALATVLKSPLFGLGEDELFTLAHDRSGSLWQALADAAAAASPSQYFAIASMLSEWRALAFDTSPYEFFARILDRHGMRKAFSSRLGSQCHDALDEFLTLAQNFKGATGSGLAAFVRFVRKSGSGIKREADRPAGEVRIMTVHGAKGLEANVVILADTCSAASTRNASLYFLNDRTGKPAIPCWAVKGAATLEPLAAAKDACRQREDKERGRLLYVAMTRARDRLYIAGFQSRADPAKGCWYETVMAALQGQAVAETGFDGRPVFRLSGGGPQVVADVQPEREPIQLSLPQWHDMRLAEERGRKVLAASNIGVRTFIAEGANAGWIEPSRVGRDAARREGQFAHLLLQLLPGLDASLRNEAAASIAALFQGEVARDRIDIAVRNAAALLEDPRLSSFFCAGMTECGVIGYLDAAGKRVILTGQIDRIVIGKDRISIIDYKSGASNRRAGAADNHAAQLAAYRFLVGRIYPTAEVDAVVLGTLARHADYIDKGVLDGIVSDLRHGLGSPS